MRDRRLSIADGWSHKRDGTPQTHEAAFTRGNPLLRLFEAGDIERDQLASAEEIGEVMARIERDVSMGAISYEPRVDTSRSNCVHASLVFLEGIRWVEMELAYSLWRARLPRPPRLILDMLGAEPIPFSTVALRYGIHKRRAKRLLIDALNRWPEAREDAEATLEAARAGMV